jgi:hypothetical protein
MADEMSMALDDLLRKTQLSDDVDPCLQVAMNPSARVSGTKSIAYASPQIQTRSEGARGFTATRYHFWRRTLSPSSRESRCTR